MMMLEPPQQNADLDAYARKQGFQNYAQMKAFLARRSESLQASHTVQGAPAPQPAPPPRPVDRQPNEGVFGYIIRKMGGG